MMPSPDNDSAWQSNIPYDVMYLDNRRYLMMPYLQIITWLRGLYRDFFFEQQFFPTKNFFEPKFVFNQNCFIGLYLQFEQQVFLTKNNCFFFDQNLFIGH